MDGERELARILRFVDGDGAHPAAEVRFDRLERAVGDHALELDELRDAGVIEHVNAGRAHSVAVRGALGVIGRGGLHLAVLVANTLILAWLALHGVPIGGQ